MRKILDIDLENLTLTALELVGVDVVFIADSLGNIVIEERVVMDLVEYDLYQLVLETQGPAALIELLALRDALTTMLDPDVVDAVMALAEESNGDLSA